MKTTHTRKPGHCRYPQQLWDNEPRRCFPRPTLGVGTTGKTTNDVAAVSSSIED